MQDPQERKALVKHFSNRARKAARVGTRYLVPRVLDDHGDPLPTEKAGNPQYVWQFTLKEARLLKALQLHDGNLEKAVTETGSDLQWAKKFLQRKSAESYLSEASHLAALAEVADKNYVTGRLVSVANGQEKPSDDQKWALKELKDIVIPKQLASLKIETNVFQMPQMTPEQEKAAREFFDTIATEETHA